VPHRGVEVTVANLSLSLSCGNYDRTRFLVDGTVQAEGIDLTVIPLVSGERHDRFTRNLEFDICELQMGVFLGWKSRGAPFTAIPVFPHRGFFHGNVVINTKVGIETPADLAGKTVGMQAHFNPVTIWMRGLLQEEFGVPPASLKIRTNAGEQVPGWMPPPWMDHARMPEGGRVEDALRAGEIDLIIPPEVYESVRTDSDQMRRLWPDFKQTEMDYFRRTGIFPIRHTVVIKNDILEEHPWVALSVMKAFTKAKELGFAHVRDPRRSFLAWYGAELEAEEALFGPDPWPYTVEGNRVALETMARYAAVCGVTEDVLAIDDMFVASTLDVSRIRG
jgi:4,5-dihydroxyphthalate decarboxylase